MPVAVPPDEAQTIGVDHFESRGKIAVCLFPDAAMRYAANESGASRKFAVKEMGTMGSFEPYLGAAMGMLQRMFGMLSGMMPGIGPGL